MCISISRTAAWPATRPEIAFLLSALRLSLDPQADREISPPQLPPLQGGDEAGGDLNWSFLGDTALRHGVMPLLYRNLEVLKSDLVPKQVLSQLQAQYHANALRNLFLSKELLNILRRLTSCGIGSVALKGPALAAQVHGNIGLRQFNDLDILVRREDVLQAARLLLAHGFAVCEPKTTQLTAGEIRSVMASEYHMGFWSMRGKFALELHWAFAPLHYPWQMDCKGLWDRLETLKINNVALHTMGREDLLLFLSLHGAKHGWVRLGWVSDLAHLIERSGALNWEWVMTKARQLRCERVLFPALLLTRNLFDTAYPAYVQKRIQADRVGRALAKKALCWLLDPQQRAHSLRRHLFLLTAQDSLGNQARYLWSHLAEVFRREGTWKLPRLRSFLKPKRHPDTATRIPSQRQELATEIV